MKSLNRRNFIKASTAGAVGLAVTSHLNANNTAKSQQEIEKEIITRKLGNTGIEIPVLSIGCGGVDSPSIIRAAMQVGIKHFDTANRYQQGNSEKLLGETLKDYDRTSFIISTKIQPQQTEKRFLEMLDESLNRLQMDYVDILYLHAISSRSNALNKISLSALQKAKKLGKAKHIGLSTHKNEPEVIQAAIDSKLYEVVLTAINFKQEHYLKIKEKISEATKAGLGIIGMKVMAGGYLDESKNKPINHLAALKWVVNDPNIHSTIPSMINLDQLKANMPLLNDINLTRKESKDLAIAQQEIGLYCNACEACISSCRKNLPIPELMRAYMYSYGYHNSIQAKELISILNTGENPCDGCNDCTARCIKGFDLAYKIKSISRLATIPNDFLA
jgi:predicted aldo/keto reductase-like oxidoreductase